jgi:hypothetical protein
LETPPQDPPTRPDEADYSHIDDKPRGYEHEALISSRSAAHLGVSLCVGAFSAAGLFMATGLLHRFMFGTALLATALSIQWSVRLLTVALAGDIQAMQGWNAFLQAAWHVQKFSFWAAVGLTVLTGIAPAP